MSELHEAVKTVTTLSPPLVLIVIAAIANIILKSFLPEKYLMPIATIGCGALAPYMFTHETLAYTVPSPPTALVLIGAIMGFIGSVLHRRIDRWIRNKMLVGNGDTVMLTRADATRSAADRAGQRPANAADTSDRTRSDS